MSQQHYVPDWDNCDTWQVHDWEQALKYSDHLASRYFRMLERFGDLPDADELIARKLGEQQLVQFEENPFGHDWYEEGEELDDCDHDDILDVVHQADALEPGDALYYESFPVFQRSRQIALGWCNILASVLRPEDRFWGITILFYMGRLLSYLALSIEDGTFSRINASIAFGKRALQQVNMILGELDSKMDQNARYQTLFKIVREHLMEDLDLVVDYLLECRTRLTNDQAAG